MSENSRETTRRSRTRRVAILMLALVSLIAAGCGDVARMVLDLPAAGPRPPRTPAPVAASSRSSAAPGMAAAVDLPPPLLETSLAPDSILRWLPRDHAGNADWVAALRQGLYRPRPTIEMLPAHAVDPNASPFAFDFYFPNEAPDSLMDASFPHSVHTALIECRQCHGPVVRYKNNKIDMSAILAGDFCGKCHGKVAFSPLNACERCHTRLPMPEDRVQPELMGTITMTRHPSDSSFATGVSLDSLPPARFPHWVHRIRYQCKVCHTRIFEPTAGANVIRMADINQGRACGTCHNGRIAFRAGFGECQRCHAREPEQMSDAAPGQ